MRVPGAPAFLCSLVLAASLATTGCSGPDSADIAPVDCSGAGRRLDDVKVVACLGDSNTHQPEQTGWCDLLAEEYAGTSLKFLNYGFPGGGVVPSQPRFPVLDAYYWLDRALALAPPSVVILAYGTNDLRRHIPPADVLSHYEKLAERAKQAGVERVLVALTPPMHPKTVDKSAEVLELNELIRKEFPPEDQLDFFTGIDVKTDLVPDGIHFSAAGHEKRAAAVREAMHLRPGEAPTRTQPTP